MNRSTPSSTNEILLALQEWRMVAPLHVDKYGIRGFFFDLVDISGTSKGLVLHILSKIYKSLNHEQLLVTFRGDNKVALGKRLSYDEETTQVEAYRTLFYLGEKSKHFYRTDASSLKRLKHFRCIQDASEKTFSYMFTRISSVMRNNKSASLNQKGRLDNFIKNNQLFVDFFKEHNRTHFIETCTKNPNDRVCLRDYYLYLLHTLGRLGGISDLSFFVSTSRDYQQALKFTNKSSPIVFLYFITYPFAEFGLDLNTVEELCTKVTEMGLPAYTYDVFPNQKEFAVKGGLFPHFLLGVLEPDERRLVLNYHLFEDDNSDIDFTLAQGLRVNQSSFIGLLRSSGYVGYLTRHWSGAYVSELID